MNTGRSSVVAAPTMAAGTSSSTASNNTMLPSAQKLNPQQQHMLQLLQSSIRCVQSGTFHPILYQTLGALHQYVGLLQQAGFSSTGGVSTSPLLAPSSRPAFYLVQNTTAKEGGEQQRTGSKEEEEKKANHKDHSTNDSISEASEDDDDDVMAYGWMQLLSSSSQKGDGGDAVDEPSWNPVLALLIQKDKDDEPCLWITREVLVDDADTAANANRQETKKWRPSTTLETLHSIPLWRRLQSCRYQNFYGNHRLVLKLRHHQSPILLQCPTAHDVHNWVQQIQWWKKHAGSNNSNNDVSTNHDNIELEMVDTYDSQEQSKDHYVNVIMEDDLRRGESMTSLPDSTSPEKGTHKGLAEQLQEAEDTKRVQKEAQELADRERTLQHEEEKLKREQQQQATSPARKALTRVEREQEARKRGEENRRRKELEYEREKLEKEKRRRAELELQRQKAREEQRKKDLLKKQKFLEAEERKERLKAEAAAVTKTTIVDSGVFGATKDAPKPPPVAARSVSSPTRNASVMPAVNKSMTPPATTSKKDTDSLWFSLDQQMSAFEAADAERRKAEEAKRKLEEEKNQKAEQERRIRLGLEESSEDLEEVRKRIAEEARQRIVQEDLAKHSPVKAAPAMNADGTARIGQPEQGISGQARSGPPNLPATNHSSHSSPPQQEQYAHHPPSSQANGQWQQQQHVQGNQQGAHPSQQQQTQHHVHAHRYPQTPHSHHHSSNPSSSPVHCPNPASAPRQQRQQPPQPHTSPGPQHVHRHANPSVHQTQHSAANEKYASMANQSNDGQAPMTRLKHAILKQWALQPPQLQLLRPIEVLTTTIHSVFPPALGIPGHQYFTKWKPITATDIADEEKLKKSVRKVRFFLHPDKLPNDFSVEQRFACKLLWDVTNDAYEDYKKGKEDLDWIT